MTNVTISVADLPWFIVKVEKTRVCIWPDVSCHPKSEGDVKTVGLRQLQKI